MTHERGKIEHQKGKKMGTSWQCQTSIRLCKTKLDFEVMHPCIQARWLEAADLFSSNLWHTAAFVRLAKWEQLISSALFFLATDLRLQSAVPSLIVTSWAPFRVCLKANIGLLIGYFNALNYGEKEEKRKKKSLAHTSLQKFQSLEESDPETKALWISPLPCSPKPGSPSPSFLHFSLLLLSSNSANLSDTFSCQLPRYFPLNVTWQQLAATFELLYMSYAKKKKQLKYNDYWNTRFKTKSKCFQWGARGNLF